MRFIQEALPLATVFVAIEVQNWMGHRFFRFDAQENGYRFAF